MSFLYYWLSKRTLFVLDIEFVTHDINWPGRQTRRSRNLCGAAYMIQ